MDGASLCSFGLTVGCIVHGLDDECAQASLRGDVTYATNNEFGFDYLRDNMKFRLEDMVQRPFSYAIVDEVDSILIDEARTPLIISGPTEDATEQYVAIDKLIPDLTEDDYEKDEKVQAVTLTEDGTEHIEQLLLDAGLLAGGNLYDMANISMVHHANQGLRAHKLFERDTDYIVQNGKVIIIDEFTGRMMEGRRYSDGLHQALEAKEGVGDRELKTRLWPRSPSRTISACIRKLAGMTGTAMTEAGEFLGNLRAGSGRYCRPTCRLRIDDDDEVYRTRRKEHRHRRTIRSAAAQQPVLVGTRSIEKSEQLAAAVNKRQIEAKGEGVQHRC